MGEINILTKLENTFDRDRFQEGQIAESKIRTHHMNAIVDTGAVMLVLPQDVVEKLGLRTRRTVIVAYADERKEERSIAGAVTLEIADRSMITECVVGPPLSEALIGQVVLEELDLVADCQARTVAPRPESPIYPLLKLKYCASPCD
jgi:clan AA aspartic protease